MIFLCFFVMNNFGMDVSQCWEEMKINVYLRVWTQPHLKTIKRDYIRNHNTIPLNMCAYVILKRVTRTSFTPHGWGQKVWKQMWMRGKPVWHWDRKLGGPFHTSDQVNNFPTFMNAALSVCAADRLIRSSWWNKERKQRKIKIKITGWLGHVHTAAGSF